MTPEQNLNLNDARQIVRAVFEEMGIDMSTPEARTAARKDFMFMREWRMAIETGRGAAVKSVIGLLITGLFGLLILGLNTYFGQR